jgi:hypothetical protein
MLAHPLADVLLRRGQLLKQRLTLFG